MEITIVGANGFVGSAIVRACQQANLDFIAVTRENYNEYKGQPSDVVINVSGNSRKYLAATDPIEDMERTVVNTLRICHDFPAFLHVLCSSIDIYNNVADPRANGELANIVPEQLSNYGFHKYLAEHVLRKYAADWLIIRLGGMVGPNLQKNPIFDILHDRPLWVHPDSRYQYISTDAAAASILRLIEGGFRSDIFNLCGDGLISIRQVLAMIGREAQTSNLVPEVYNVNIDKIKGVLPIPRTVATVAAFVRSYQAKTPSGFRQPGRGGQ